MTMPTPFFDGSYWDYCTHIAPDCFYAFPDGAVDVDFERLNEKRRAFLFNGMNSCNSTGRISLDSVHMILENALPDDILTEYPIRLENNELERLRNCRLVIDETPDNFDAFIKYPYYRMRGKHITEEQAFEVIWKTDAHFHSHVYWNSRHTRKLVGTCHFQNCWFDPIFPSNYGWVHPNGIIGINSHTLKYPTFLEMLEELLEYQKAFPFLDFVAAITWWDENPHYECYGGKAQRDEASGQYPDFLDHVTCGVRLDGSTIEFLGRERAIQTYQEYETLYSDSNFRVYIPEFCRSKTCPFDMEAYRQRCIAAFCLEKD